MTVLLSTRSDVTVAGVVAGDYNFGARLSELLEELDVSAEELGRRLGYSTRGRLVRKWKNQGTAPSHRNLIRIADALGVPESRLLPTPEERARAAAEVAEGSR